MAKAIKNREPITIRTKELAKGRKSIYLDYYVEGTRTHKYEFLKLYIIPERTKADRMQNANTMQAAKAIQAQRLIDRANGKAGIEKNAYGKISLSDYLKHYEKSKAKVWRSEECAKGFNAMRLHLENYKSTNIAMSQIDKAYCMGFIDYLAKGKTKCGKPLSKRTQQLYWAEFTAVLNMAVREDILSVSPISKLSADDKKPISGEGKARAFLDIDELRLLAQTPCQNENVKRAFLFACFCGLRISDVAALKWGDIRTSEGKAYIDIVMTKTQRSLHVPLNDNAIQWLPERNEAKGADNVFILPQIATINYHVRKWAKAANINKGVCFHVSRHTFATTLLTMGADIYTTSKLLGHTTVTTTQIYAEIVNKKKSEAVSMLDNIKL